MDKTIKEIRSEMQGGMACRMDPSRSIPLQQNSIRFSVLRRNGLSSNSWRVWVGKPGDVYIACRDHLGGLKISLHRSGKCHIASNQKEVIDGDRYLGKWDRPITEEIRGLRPFQLLFPTKALCVNQEARDENKALWAKNEVYIEAPESPFGTTVSFVIVEDTIKTMNAEAALSYPLAIMPAWPGTNLWVVVSHLYEGKMLEVAGNIIRNFGDLIDEDTVEQLAKEPDGKVFTITVSGHADGESVYLMPFPVEIGTL